MWSSTTAIPRFRAYLQRRNDSAHTLDNYTLDLHIPSVLVVAGVTAHRKPPEVRICRLRNQSAVGTRPPSTSTPHWPARGFVKLLGMILSPGNRRHFPVAISTDP